jgi:protein-L-isoaspartate(D-aspartate) O-methyltransferase
MIKDVVMVNNMNTDFTQARFNTIEQQIRPWNVNDIDILNALKLVQREQFVPKEYASLAFADIELSIPEFNHRYLLSPKIEAKALQAIKTTLEQKHGQNNYKEHILNVLIIGSDLGYISAILQSIDAINIAVTILDENKNLLSCAEQNLHNNKFNSGNAVNITQKFTDVIEHKYDAIIATGSVAQAPQNWLNALRDGASLIAFIGKEPVLQAMLIQRQNTNFIPTSLFETWVNRLPNIPELNSFVF